MALKPYKKQAWVDHQVDEATSEIVVLGTPVDKIHLDHLEDGIQTADARAIEALGGVEGLQTTQHSHSNKGVLDGITSALVTAWNSAVTHITDAVKHITAAERTLWNTITSKADADEVMSQMGKKANVGLTSSMKIYVSPTGNDTTGDGSTSKPYKTIQKAVNSAPKNLNRYNVVINLATGIYTGNVDISSFLGQSQFAIIGDFDNVAGVKVNGVIAINSCRCSVFLGGFTATPIVGTDAGTNDGVIKMSNADTVLLNKVNIDGSGKTTSGVSLTGYGDIGMTSCQITDCIRAINTNTSSGTRGLSTLNMYYININNCDIGVFANACIVGVHGGSNAATTKYQKSAAGMVFDNGSWV